MKSLFRTLLLSGPLLLPVYAFAARAADFPAQTQISVRQEGNILTVEGAIAAPLDRLTAWTVLTDYARFPKFVPGIHGNRVLEQRGDFRLIEQRGMIANKQFQMPFQGVMQVEEHKRDGVPEGMKILYVSGPLKDVRGEWNIQAGKPLGLSYRMRMDLTKTPFPPTMAVSIVEQQVRTWVDAFSQEMQVMQRNKE